MKVDGQCHCGAIVYEAEVEPGTVGVCHCLDCQRLTGSPFRANVRAEAGGFCILKGQPRHYVKTGDSGAKRIHAFCEVCASPIYSCAIENPQSYAQRTGLYCNGMSLAGQCGIYGRSGVSPGLHLWPMCVPEFEGEA